MLFFVQICQVLSDPGCFFTHACIGAPTTSHLSSSHVTEPPAPPLPDRKNARTALPLRRAEGGEQEPTRIKKTGQATKIRRNLAAEAGVAAAAVVGEGGGEVDYPWGVKVVAETIVAVAAAVGAVAVDRAVEAEAEEVEGGGAGAGVRAVVVVEGTGGGTRGGAAGGGVEARTRRGFSKGGRRQTRRPWATTTARTRPERRRRRACFELWADRRGGGVLGNGWNWTWREWQGCPGLVRRPLSQEVLPEQ